MIRYITSLFLLLFTFSSIAQEQKIAWPKVMTFSKGELTFYMPQPDTFKDNLLTFDMAVGVQLTGEQRQYGALKLSCRLDIDSDNDTAQCNDFKVLSINFPALGDKQDKLKQIVTAQVADRTITISSSRLEALLRVAVIEKKRQKEQFKFEPPKIYFTTKPTALIFIDGDPKLKPLKESGLMQVINTAFVIILDNKTGTYYLYAGNHWMQSKSIDKDWVKAKDVPDDIKKLSGQPNEKLQDIDNLIITYKPGALIQFDGKPEFTPIAGTDLLYVTNSKDNVFLQIKSQDYFILLSGRWFKGNSLSDAGSWTYIPGNKLPESFKKINPESKKGSVLVSVPGTEMASDAVIKNRLPQTAIVNKNTTTIEVNYDGQPQFDAIGSIKFAVNADKPVFDVSGTYFANYQGVWFTSASATGPWQVATKVPEAIYDIPPSNPYYYVTYNHVYGSQGDDVYVGYTPGYEGSYVSGDTVIYGTGYDYDGWVGDNYYIYPQTWGYGYTYSPYYGWYPRAPFARAAWFGAGFVAGSLATRHYWRHHHARTYYRHQRDHYARNQYRQWRRNNVQINRPAKRPVDKQRLQRAIASGAAVGKIDTAKLKARTELRQRDQIGKTKLQQVDRNKLGKVDKGKVSQIDKARAKQHVQQQRVHQKAKHQAARKNNVYVGSNGSVYRHHNNQWQRSTKQGWQKASNHKYVHHQQVARKRSQHHYQRARHQVHRGGHHGGRRHMGGRGRRR